MISSVLVLIIFGATSAPQIVNKYDVISQGDRWICKQGQRVIWTRKASYAAAPPAVTSSGKVLLSRTDSDAILCLSPNGKTLWRVKSLPSIYDPFPIIANEHYVVDGEGNFIYPADPDLVDLSQQRSRWRIAVRNISTGNSIWSSSFYDFGFPIGFNTQGFVLAMKPASATNWFLGRYTKIEVVLWDLASKRMLRRCVLPKKLEHILQEIVAQRIQIEQSADGISMFRTNGGKKLYQIRNVSTSYLEIIDDQRKYILEFVKT